MIHLGVAHLAGNHDGLVPLLTLGVVNREDLYQKQILLIPMCFSLS